MGWKLAKGILEAGLEAGRGDLGPEGAAKPRGSWIWVAAEVLAIKMPRMNREEKRELSASMSTSRGPCAHWWRQSAPRMNKEELVGEGAVCIGITRRRRKP